MDGNTNGKKLLRIAVVAENSSYGGISTYCLNLCSELQKKNIEVYLLVPCERRVGNKWLLNAATGRHLPVYPLLADKNWKLPFIIADFVRKNKISIVHTNGYRLNTFLRISRLLCSLSFFFFKHVTTVHGINPWQVIDWKTKIYYGLDYMLSFTTSLTIAVSEYTRRIFIKRAWVVPKKVKTVYNGVSLPVAVSGPFSAKIVFAGRLSIEKGIDFLIKVIEAFYRKQDEIALEFEIWGDGPELPKILRLQEKYPGKVFYKGYAADMSLVLKQAAVVIVPSVIEQLPLIVLEAMSWKVPVVASRVGGIPEIITDNYNGLLVDYGDVEGFVEKILLLMNDKCSRDKFISNAYSVVREKFSLEKNITAYLNIIRTL